MSRFEETLGEEPHRTLLKEIFDVMIQRLGACVLDLGQDLAGDSTWLSARRQKEKHAQREAAEGLPQANGGRKEYTDEAGVVYCYDRQSEPMVRHRMAYIGYEPERETVKYRCPARHEGWSCPMDEICNAGKAYGKTVRVSREIDLRRFPALPRATKKFERLYKGRTAMERVNARLKIFWGADDGNIAGSRRFVGKVGAVMLVHAAFATLLAAAPGWEGSLSHTRLTPVAKALHEKLPAR